MQPQNDTGSVERSRAPGAGAMKKVVTGLAVVAPSISLAAGAPSTAEAASCRGINSRTILTFDYSTGVTVEDIMIDSCKVKSIISKYGVAKDAAGLVGLLGAGFWPAGVTAGVVFGWAWNNQSQLIGCSSGGKGIRLRQWAGMITGCYSQ